MSTLETQYREFLRNNRGGFCSFEEWNKINARLIEQELINIKKEQKQHLIDMMKADEELGLYDEPFKHKVETIPAEEILANRSNAYEFIDFDKQETKELNPYVGPFLLNNGFEKRENNNYYNSECTVLVVNKYYEVIFKDPICGGSSMFTDSWSIYHLIGILTWFDLIDKNYKK
jgi:hypothetical protein